ncbi:thioesterase family protein [Streptomyces sp. NPDC006798]|uniref:acyl-CoA thioesterase n=1 Tax=Streptomyces sp. NPDC006798 TaxID=3155462 RepID=UPI0033ED6464
MDLNGYISNAGYTRYLEEGRMSMFADLAPEDPRSRLVNNFLVAEHTIRFTNPLTYQRTPISVILTVGEVRAAAFTLECEIRDQGTTYLKARTLMAAYDLAMRRTRRLSESETERLSRYKS